MGLTHTHGRYARPEERRAVGARVDPSTAEVWFVYGEVIDPYCEFELSPEEQCIGREWFAADPVERVAVHFYDLPAATRDALEGKRRTADREGWEHIRVAAMLSGEES